MPIQRSRLLAKGCYVDELRRRRGMQQSEWRQQTPANYLIDAEAASLDESFLTGRTTGKGSLTRRQVSSRQHRHVGAQQSLRGRALAQSSATPSTPTTVRSGDAADKERDGKFMVKAEDCQQPRNGAVGGKPVVGRPYNDQRPRGAGGFNATPFATGSSNSAPFLVWCRTAT